MKNGVMLLISGVIGCLLLAIVMTICGNMNRRVDLQENLSTAMENSVMELVEQNGSWNEEEMIAACIGSMMYAMDSAMDVMLEVHQMDAQRGILSLSTTGNYMHPNGTESKTKWERTVIYDKQEEAEKMGVCNVSFYRSKEDMICEDDCYKRYSVREGECIHTPVEPSKPGVRFAGWKDYNDYMADFSQPVSQDLCYYAAWE